MTLEDTYFISQIIAAVAIIASLIFVGLQLRQSERVQRGAMHQARADRIISMQSFHAQPHVAAARVKWMTAPETITAEELQILEAACRSSMINFEDIHWQAATGLIDEASVRRTAFVTRIFFAGPAQRAWWSLNKKSFEPDFVALMEREILDPQPMMDFSNRHQTWLKEVNTLKLDLQSQAQR